MIRDSQFMKKILIVSVCHITKWYTVHTAVPMLPVSSSTLPEGHGPACIGRGLHRGSAVHPASSPGTAPWST